MPNNRGSLFWSAAPVSRSLTWQRETIGKHVVFKIQVKRVSKINNLQHKTSFPTLPELHSALNKNGLVVLNFSSSLKYGGEFIDTIDELISLRFVWNLVNDSINWWFCVSFILLVSYDVHLDGKYYMLLSDVRIWRNLFFEGHSLFLIRMIELLYNQCNNIVYWNFKLFICRVQNVLESEKEKARRNKRILSKL